MGTRVEPIGKTTALFGEPGHRAAAGVEPERGAARESETVDRLHRVAGLQQRCVARSGAAAAKIDRGNRGVVEDDGRDARGKGGVIGMADADACDIGQEVVHVAPTFVRR